VPLNEQGLIDGRMWNWTKGYYSRVLLRSVKTIRRTPCDGHPYGKKPFFQYQKQKIVVGILNGEQDHSSSDVRKKASK
ncbi:hypothetical protein KIN20_002062, partial [Parelaphostrongylus tenuis]